MCWLGLFLTASSVFSANTLNGYGSVASPGMTFLLLVFGSGMMVVSPRLAWFGLFLYYAGSLSVVDIRFVLISLAFAFALRSQSEKEDMKKYGKLPEYHVKACPQPVSLLRHV